ncbi:hypothetical protein [Methylobacterium indicum]|uniref:Uncharacterized protein n=1 Tax=Methylobacterium indicum TaxID=1775910 RepID=A0A8H8WYF0_9HYPH|nr:hypothetical protein [Methylobacterium indicum]BCM86729.1 hypothetical protein mvi_51900 [Methylobacterium indicum]
MNDIRPVPANNLSQVREYIDKGGRLVVLTCLKFIVIDRKVLRRFERAGAWILKGAGEGYRLRQGQGSVYLLPGLLEYVIE